MDRETNNLTSLKALLWIRGEMFMLPNLEIVESRSSILIGKSLLNRELMGMEMASLFIPRL